MIYPSEEGLKALEEHKRKTDIHILPIQYRNITFDDLKSGDILCTLQVPFKLMKVGGIINEENTVFKGYNNCVYVKYFNEVRNEAGQIITGEWLHKDKIDNGSIVKLILE